MQSNELEKYQAERLLLECRRIGFVNERGYSLEVSSKLSWKECLIMASGFSHKCLKTSNYTVWNVETFVLLFRGDSFVNNTIPLVQTD